MISISPADIRAFAGRTWKRRCAEGSAIVDITNIYQLTGFASDRRGTFRQPLVPPRVSGGAFAGMSGRLLRLDCYALWSRRTSENAEEEMR
jgi:hypothetical protein